MNSAARMLLSVVLPGCLSLTTSVAIAKKPNVLFIVCDDLNTHVSTSGYPHINTPAFDELAAAGMTFGRAYCQYPVCGPSRASFLHGLYPQSSGVLDNKSDIRDVRPGTVSMPQRFKESGSRKHAKTLEIMRSNLAKAEAKAVSRMRPASNKVRTP